MKKRIAMLLAGILVLSLLSPWAMAAETEAPAEETTEATEETEASRDTSATSGTCGDGLAWVLEGNTLTVSGSGEMDDGAPWDAHKSKIEKLVLTGGVTKVGAKSFYKYDRLETIDFGGSLVEIGTQAFYGCEDLTRIHLPSTFRTFGVECFRDCAGLTEVYCDGGMPRFNSSCLWNGNYISVFYPTTNPWPQDAVNNLVSNFGGRLGVMMGSFDASAEPEEVRPVETRPAETEAPTEASTEALTEVPTEPQIIYITEAPTEETTEPVTEPVTEAPAEAPTEPTERSELDAVAEKVSSDSWIGIVLIAGVITFLLVGALVFRASRNKGGRYKG